MTNAVRGTAVYERELAMNRARKERYRGACRVCGKPTSGCNGPSKPYEFCLKHAMEREGLRRRGTGPANARLLALLADGPMRYSEIRDSLGISSGWAAVMLRRLVKYGLLERISHGVYRVTDAQ